jgi:hypothetical protein
MSDELDALSQLDELEDGVPVGLAVGDEGDVWRMDGGGFAWRLDEEDNDVRGVEYFLGILSKRCVTNEGIFSTSFKKRHV